MASPRLTPDPGASAGLANSGGIVGHEHEECQRPLDAGVSGRLGPEDYLGVHAKASTGPGQTFGMRHHGAVVNSLNTGKADAQESDSDVSNVGFPTSSSSSSSIRQRRLVTPSWTSTPPTPPHTLSAKARTLSNPSENVSIADGFQAQRRSRLSQPRPASVAVFPDSTTRGISSLSSRPSFILTEQNTTGKVAAGANAHAETFGARSIAFTQPGHLVKRRHSLPPNSWKPLPPIPDSSHSPHTHSIYPLTRPRLRCLLRSEKSLSDLQRHRSASIPRSPNSSLSPHSYLMPGALAVGADGASNNDNDNVLSPSLSRVPKPLHRRASSPLRLGTIASQSDASEQYSNSKEGLRGPTSAGSSYKSALSSPAFPSPDPQSPRTSRDSTGRKLFHLDADDEDAAEDDEDAKLSRESSLQREASSEEGKRGTEPGVSASKAKRYHAVLELLTTELGYLMDLKALASVSFLFGCAYTHLSPLKLTL